MADLYRIQGSEVLRKFVDLSVLRWNNKKMHTRVMLQGGFAIC